MSGAVNCMDLRNNQIKMRELFANPAAKKILMSSFPEFNNSFMLRMAENMSLASVIKMAGGRVKRERIEQAIAELQAL